ncbi:MAG: tetratricopeptide repeat protein [Terriglobales bacterium]
MKAQLPSSAALREFPRLQVLRLLGLSAQRLRRWERQGLMPAKRAYGYADLVKLQKLRQLSPQVGARDLRAGLKALRQWVPDQGDPLARLGLFADRRRLVAHIAGQPMEALSGQLRLPLLPPAPAPVTVLRPRDANPSAAAEDWFTYAVSLEERPENRDLAAEAYLRCLELDSRHASAMINLGTLRYHQGQFAAAEACYRRALATDPAYALAQFDLGNVLDETGRLAEAIAAYTAACRLAPEYADAHYNLALAYEKAGQRRRAIPHWRRYLRLDGNSAWAQHARNQLQRALAQERLQLVAAGR